LKKIFFAFPLLALTSRNSKEITISTVRKTRTSQHAHNLSDSSTCRLVIVATPTNKAVSKANQLIIHSLLLHTTLIIMKLAILSVAIAGASAFAPSSTIAPHTTTAALRMSETVEETAAAPVETTEAAAALNPSPPLPIKLRNLSPPSTTGYPMNPHHATAFPVQLPPSASSTH
jgi:hypothetical protein